MNQNEIETAKEKRLSEVIIEALRMRNFTVEKLSQTTGISERFIELLLNEEFKKLPAAPYIHGYILKISEVLNLDGNKLWKEYFKHNEEVNRSGRKDHLPPNRFITRKFNKKVIVGIIALIIVVVYVLIRLPAILGNPSLTITNLKEDTTIVETATFKAIGAIDPRDQLTINDEVVYPGEDGTFEKELILEPGFNTFEFKTKKLLGQTHSITKQIFYKTPEQQEPQLIHGE